MNCFQLIKTVLDEIYARIPSASDGEKDEKIKQKIAHLSKEYSELTRGARIDYRDDVTRFAYIYKYVTSHANMVYQAISENTELAALFDQQTVNVSCIGGGPGSDFLGILKHILLTGKTPKLRCSLFDREQAWSDCWSDVDQKLESQLRITTFVQPFDVTDEETWSINTKYLRSDLFTMIYFLSEVWVLRERAEAFFDNLFSQARPGALFLYIDNKSPQFYNWFDLLAGKHSLEPLQTFSGRLQIDDLSEEKRDLGEYYEKFGSPKIRGEVAYRIGRKLEPGIK